MKRLFVGVPLAESLWVNINSVYKDVLTAKDISVVKRDNLHFTMKFLGLVEDNLISKIREVLYKIALQNHKFTIRLNALGAFPSKDFIKVIWIGTDSENLDSLMRQINHSLDFVRKNDYEEKPHLTLARISSSKSKQVLQKILDKYAKTEFGEMKVDNFVLYESILHEDGPEYRELQRFELKG